jgi:hypothetical protein
MPAYFKMAAIFIRKIFITIDRKMIETHFWYQSLYISYIIYQFWTLYDKINAIYVVMVRAVFWLATIATQPITPLYLHNFTQPSFSISGNM